MKKYSVYTMITTYYVTEVEANSEAEAMQYVEDNEQLLAEPYDENLDVWSAKEIE